MNGADYGCGFWCWFTNNHEEMRTAAFILAGLLGIGIAIWRTHVANKQADAALSQSKTAEMSLVNERSKSGIELLGHRNVTVRLGAIFTLVELAGLYPDELPQRVAKMFQAHLTYPPTFGTDRGGHKKGNVDYKSPDTVEIIKLINSGSLKPATDGMSLPYGAPFRIVEGKVKANPDHSDYEKWKFAAFGPPTYSS